MTKYFLQLVLASAVVLAGVALRADISIVKGGRYIYNGVAACEVVGVGGAGIRIKFESGGFENLSMDQAKARLSIPGRGCSASLPIKKQLANLKLINDYEVFGNSGSSGSSGGSSAGGTTIM